MCSGVGDAPAGYACPLKGEVAVENCQASMMSFLNGECVAPRDSICQKIAGSSWGCVWDDQLEDATATATTTTTSKGGDVNSNTNTRTGKGEASAASCSGSKTTTDNAECTNVRVDGDATFCVTGLACSGDGDSPIGDRCPVMGDVAVGDCHDYLASYSNGKCIAASDGVCKRASTGTWGCVWSSRDNAASYVIDTSDGNTTGTGTGSDQALVTGVAAAAAVAAVIAGIAVAWSATSARTSVARSPRSGSGWSLHRPGRRAAPSTACRSDGTALRVVHRLARRGLIHVPV